MSCDTCLFLRVVDGNSVLKGRRISGLCQGKVHDMFHGYDFFRCE